jgi:D-tyrosyl-tRNA(Tyr) deacylase
MRVVIQRIIKASVEIGGITHSSVGRGMLVLAGFENEDSDADLEYIASKLVNLRIFDDNEGVMNLSVKDTGGDIMIVSQFTLYAQTRKGNRPSYIKAAKPDISVPLYEQFVKKVNAYREKTSACGIFGADMKISLINDGPVTIIIDSKEK